MQIIKNVNELPDEYLQMVKVKDIDEAKTYCEHYSPVEAYYLEGGNYKAAQNVLWIVPKGDCGQNKSLSY